MKVVFKDSLPVHLKNQAMQMCLIPCLSYASQTWPLSTKKIHKLKLCQNRIERKLLGLKLSDKVKTKDIRKITKAIHITKNIMTQK